MDTSPNQLTRLEIHGYKSIEEANVSLSALNVLIGANGAGKSNFVSFFKFLRAMSEEQLQTHTAMEGGADSILHFGQKETPKVSFKISFEQNGSLSADLYPTAKDDFLIYNLDLRSNVISIATKAQGPEFTYSLWGIQNREDLKEDIQKFIAEMIEEIKAYIQGLQIYHFHDTGKDAKVRKAARLEENDALTPNASNLPAFLYLLQEQFPEEYQFILYTIQRVAPFIERFHLKPDKANAETIRLRWYHKQNEQPFYVSQLSDGTLRFICLATVLLQPKALLPSVLIIDEPELGLHPHAIRILAGLLKSCAAHCQVIVATQSVILINALEDANLIVVDREDNKSVFRQLDQDKVSQWMEEFSCGVGDLWDENWLGGTPQWKSQLD